MWIYFLYLNTQANKAPNPKPKKAIRKPAATIKAVIKAKQVQYAYIPTWDRKRA